MVQGKVIDADGHLLEPMDLWDNYLEAKYKDRAISMEKDKDGLEYLVIDGKPSPVSYGIGPTDAGVVVGSRNQGCPAGLGLLPGQMSSQTLPEAFADLEGFVDAWALATEAERSRKRTASSMAQIQAFYDAIFPGMEEILSYLQQFPLDDMPEQEERLLLLSFSLAEVAPSVELFKQPTVPDGYDVTRLTPHERGG